MEYLKQGEIHGNVIKEQYRMDNGDLYIVTRSGDIWKLFLNGNKKICESKYHEKIYERIPEGN